jgi:hypothetical protein
VTGDFSVTDLGRKEYDAVISSFAIHHLRSAAEYLRLYKKIRAALKQPGIFVCVDVVAGSHDLFTGHNEKEWRSFLADKGFPRSERERILSNYHIEDSPAAVGTHLSLLTEAGFNATDVMWKKANFAVYSAIS